MIDERQLLRPGTDSPRGSVGSVAPLRRLFVLLLGVVFLLGIPGITSHGECVREVLAPCSASEECSPSKDLPAGGEDSHNDGHSGICCKCPCNGLNIPVSSASATLSPDFTATSPQRPSDDAERESPVFEIFQPPKLRA